MKDIFVKELKNVKRFHSMMDKVNHKLIGIERMGLVFSDPGYGKTRTALHYAANNGAVMIRANRLMSARWFLEEIVEELGAEPKWKTKDLLRQAIDLLRERRRIIIIDEIDHLTSDVKVIETVRYLHDVAYCPIIFIGMGQADKKLRHFPHIYDRFIDVQNFQKLDHEDIQEMINQVTEVKFEADAIERIAEESQGRIREIIKLIHRAEITARANKLKTVGAKDFR